jgi:hypothetical protein
LGLGQLVARHCEGKQITPRGGHLIGLLVNPTTEVGYK